MSLNIIGRWTCPSGNRVDAVVRLEGNKLGDVQFTWDAVPHDLKDQAYYYQVIRSQAISRGYALLQLSKKG